MGHTLYSVRFEIPMPFSKFQIHTLSCMFVALVTSSLATSPVAIAAVINGSQIYANGSASVDLSHPTNRIQLLNARPGLGSAWWINPISLASDWSSTFAVTAFNGSGTSEGFSFAINGDPRRLNAIGDGGQNLGFFGFTSGIGVSNSYAVTFDMWTTGPASILGFAASSNSSIPQGNIDLSPLQLSNNAYQVQIDYSASSSIMSVLIGGQTYSQSIDLEALVGQSAYLGFTAANGEGTLDTDINTWDVSARQFPLNNNLETGPGPIPLLGLSSAFCWTRALRKRIAINKRTCSGQDD